MQPGSGGEIPTWNSPTLPVPHCGVHNTEPRILRGPIFRKIPSCAATYWEHRSENSTILILVESNPSKGFTKFENLNLNFQRFFRYITTFSNFQILKTVFLNAEFHNEPARYLGYTRDRRKHDRSALAYRASTYPSLLFICLCTWDCAASGAIPPPT